MKKIWSKIKESYGGIMLSLLLSFMLMFYEPLNLFAGNITTCCQAFKDIGEGAMLLGALEKNAGIDK